MSNYNQSLIEDYKQTIERLQKECTEKTNIIIALGEQLKAKEQKCEELKKEIAFENDGTLSDKIRAEVFKELNNENNQLKAEIEELKRGYAELTEIVSSYMDDFTGYSGELGGFDLILCVKELFQQLTHKTREGEELKKNNQILCDLYKSVDSSLQKRTEKFDRYRKALEPFEDEYFKGLDTKQIAELAKKSIRLTTENRKLENKLSDIAGICSQILDGEDYVRRIAKTILDIINKAKGG